MQGWATVEDVKAGRKKKAKAAKAPKEGFDEAIGDKLPNWGNKREAVGVCCPGGQMSSKSKGALLWPTIPLQSKRLYGLPPVATRCYPSTALRKTAHVLAATRECESPGKHPFAPLAPHGLKDATVDLDVIRALVRGALLAELRHRHGRAARR